MDVTKQDDDLEVTDLPDNADDLIDGDENADGTGRKPFPKALIIFGLGLLLGLGLAALIAWYVRTPPYNDSALRTQFSQMDDRLARIEARPDIEPVDMDPLIQRQDALSSQLVNLESRLATLEQVAENEPDFEALVSRLETLQAQGFEIPDDFVFPDMPEPADLSGVEDRLSTLEARLTELARQNASTSAAVSAVLPEPDINLAALPRFPADQLRAAADELSGEGLMQRLWSQHVRVRGEKSPRVLIKEVESHLAQDRPRAALASFDELPEAMQSLARGWRADLDAAIERADALAGRNAQQGDTP